MTICIATDSYYPNVGGVATFYNQLCRLLTSHGHTVIVLTIDCNGRNNEDPDETKEQDNVSIVTLKKSFYKELDNYKQFFRPGDYQAYYWIAIGMCMRKWLLANARVYNIDITEVTDYGGIGGFIADVDLPPVIITAHGCLLQLSRYNHTTNSSQVQVVKKLEQMSFDNADGIIAHSYLNQNDLQKYTNTTVHFATAPWIMPATPNTFDPSQENFLLVIGGMQVVKGTITMAKAISICRRKNPNCKLYWIGQDFYVAPCACRMSVYIKENFPDIWNSNFIWLGEQNRTETLEKLKAADVVVIPSDWETFNYISLEAAAFEKAIIISKNAGAEYIFNHKEDAWKVEAQNPEKLAESILIVMNDSNLRKKLGKGAKETVSRNFAPEKIIGERIIIYNDCFNRKKTATSFEERSAFLKAYLTVRRKAYYRLRAFAKKLIKGT